MFLWRYSSVFVCFLALLLWACGPAVPSNDSNNNLPEPESEAPILDQDGDGYTAALGDCDDMDDSVNPAAIEIPGNGVDDNCDGLVDADLDGDGFTEADGDCNDNDPHVNPYAPEDGGTGTGEPNGVDDDCDGEIDNRLPTIDDDGDGFTELEGDCDDEDINANPGAYDVPGNLHDEDCNGVVDDTTFHCDAGLALDDSDALNAARAIGLCHTATETGPEWGVISARWTLADGKDASPYPSFPVGHGILDGFGSVVSVREGDKLLALSSGTARQPGEVGYQDPGGFDKEYSSATSWGYEPTSPLCGETAPGLPHDSIALELKIRVPTNAISATFDFNFFTYEFPTYICSEFNDYFVALLRPIPLGQTDPNISFDSDGNAISVNNALLRVCNAPQFAGGINFTCPLGDAQLLDTGFEGHAATGWLRTTIDLGPGTTDDGVITLLFGVWDTEDGVLDSTVVIDNWKWSAQPATGSSTTPVI